MTPQLIALTCAASLVLAVPSWAREIGPEGLESLPVVDVVVLGEVHDNAAHHANQARAVAAIAPAALVFEMIDARQIARLPKDRSDAAAMAQALAWEARGWPDFAMYHPIFVSAPDARIYGGDLPRSVVTMAVRDGAAAAFGADAARFGLTLPYAEDVQQAREADLWAAHCFAMPRDMMGGMVEAQRLRDAAMAAAVLQAMDDTGGPVVVITGAEHARRDIGIPALLTLARPGLTVLSVGQIEGVPDERPPFDLWITTAGVADRGDPCEAFGATDG